MHNFCTLFDSNYLLRGLALYESLCSACGDFHIYIFAFDDKCFQTLNKLWLDKATIVSLAEFQDEELLAVKPTRSPVEYCWTCTPTIIRYALDKYNLESCTYLDADLYFRGSPAALLNEMADNSVMITEHRYTPCYDQSGKSGKYCVQFMTFRNNHYGRKVLNWWRQACNRWCYARHEDGKFGDQKYLDDWCERFEQVHVMKHPGGGIAPWNVQQYDIFERQGRLFGKLKACKTECELIFYHFHYLKFYTSGQVDMGGYRLGGNEKKLLYKPYIKHLEDIKNRVSKTDESVCVCGCSELKFENVKAFLRYIRHRLIFNVIDKNKLIEGQR
jgi:hypothetical protein